MIRGTTRALATLLCGMLLAVGASSVAAAAPYVGYSENEFSSPALDPYVDADHTARLLALGGGQVQRIGVRWQAVEQTKGVWRWSQYDAMVAADRALGIKPFLVISAAPVWARDSSSCRTLSCTVPPARKRLADWRTFVSRLLARYPDAVALEVWNEPNAPGRWQTSTGPDPRRYTTLLCNAEAAATEAAPSVPVVSGSPNVTGTTAGFIPYDEFVTSVYESGGRRCLDGLGVHAYPVSSWLPPTDRFYEILDRFRSIAASEGDAGRGLWVTEFGAAMPPTGTFAEAGQARATYFALQALLGMADVRSALVFSLLEGATDPGYGEITRDYHARQAFCTVGQVLTAVDPCGDRDGDGLTDVEEVQAGRDYTDPSA